MLPMFIKHNPIFISGEITRLMNQKPVLSNYYFNDLTDTEFLQTEKSIIIRKSEHDFFRFFCLTLDLADLKNILISLKGPSIINIPSKGSLDLWTDLFSETGFESIGIYERYYTSETCIVNKFNGKFADLSYFDSLKKMMFENFNKYTDHLPGDSEFRGMIENRQVIINDKFNELTGFFVYTFEGKKCYFNLWYDSGRNGLSLLFNVYALMNIKNIKYSYGWINSDNAVSKKLHSSFGWKPDGLKDYTYLKI